MTAGIAGHLMAVAHAAMALITSAPALRTNCEYGLNLVTMQDNYALGPDSPRPDCPTCGQTA
ncbi:hypothetical protein AB0K14_30640 [Actinosynnema sp. NPDC050801]|uniref:hypothetical protein n=1 Tax=unclassified Actinosynnema TaxID=2637065 RepID=UPI0033CD3258